MQRRYRTKKYYCGEYLEVAIYPVYTHPKKRGKRNKPTTEIQQRLNQRHTEGRLRRLLHTNFTPSGLFATLTFDDASLPASVEDAQRLLQNFLRRLKLLSQSGNLDIYTIFDIQTQRKPNQQEKISFRTEDVRKFFPKSYTTAQMQDVILRLLEGYQRQRQRSQER